MTAAGANPLDRPAARPRVLMLGPLSPPTGGMAVVIRNLAASRLAESCELTLLDTSSTVSLNAAGAKPRRRSLAARLAGQWRLLAAVHRAVHDTPRPDIIHVHTCSYFSFWRDSLYSAMARWAGCRVAWHVHGGYFARFIAAMGPLRRFFLRRALERAAAVIVLGDRWVAALRPAAPRARWRAVPNGVPMPPPPDRLAGAAAGPPGFLFLGTLSAAKGVEDILKAVAEARPRGFSGTVILAGDAENPTRREALQATIDATGCHDQVLLPGILEGSDKDRALAEAAAFLLPSYGEGLPMALLEAMAAGLPVIATRVGAVPEVVTDGVEGFLIEPGDVAALADRMLRLASDADLRKRMGAAARRRVETSYSLDHMAESILAVYREILGQESR